MRHLDRIVARLQGVRRDGRGYLARCPAHDDTNPSLAVLPQPDGRVRLHCRSAQCSIANILQRMELTFDDLSPDPDEEIIPDDDGSLIVDPTMSSSTEVAVDSDLRNRVYHTFVHALSLSPTHRDSLNRRGLNDGQINWRGYRSLTHDTCAAAIVALRSMFSDEQLLSVPGFVRGDDGALRLAGPRCGIVVPVLAINCMVQALKVRRDDTTDGRGKYMYLSGGGGSRCGTPVHVPLGIQGPIPEVRLTEGELKADIATALNGPTIGLAGTSTWTSALPVLQQLGVQTVRLAFDADFATKPHVARDLLECSESLRNNGYSVSIERWPLEVAKGIDDLLVAGRQPDLLTGEEAQPFLASIRTSIDECTHQIHVGDVDPPANTAEDVVVTTFNTEEVLPFPMEVFPVVLQQFVTQAADSVGCPVDLVAIPMIACAATAIGTSRALEVKSGWKESARTYVAIVAPPGSAKTPAASIVTRPLFAQQALFRQEYTQARQAYDDAERHSQNQRRGRQVVSSGAPASPAEQVEMTVACNEPAIYESTTIAASDTSQSEEAAVAPVKPTLKRVVVGDATTEALAPILAKNPRGIMMVKDELSGWVAGLNQYKGGKGSDLQFFLSCWSGEAAIVDRKTQEEPIFVPHPFLNVFGGIQPDMLAALCHNGDQHGDKADGFLDRILFAFPASHPVPRWTDQGINSDVERVWSDCLTHLFRLQLRHDGELGIDLPQIVQFTPEGRQAWANWWNGHAAEMDAVSFPTVLKGPWSKLRTYCARFSLVFQMLRMACDESPSEDVDAASVNHAVRLIDYFKSHDRKVYRHLRRDTADRQIEQIVAWIRGHGGECTARQIQRANVGSIKKVSDATKLLKDLLDRGLGRLEDREADNHKKVTYFVLGNALPDSVG